MPEVQERPQFGRRFLHALERFLAAAHFLQVGIGQRLHDGHPAGGLRCPHHGLPHRHQTVSLAQFLGRMTDTFPEQRVTAAQMMIQKRQRRADGEAVQPERQFRQFHGHRVQVDAIDRAFQHNAAHEVPVVQLVLPHWPAVLSRLLLNLPPQCGDPLGQWRPVWLLVVRPGYQCGSFGNRVQNLPGEVIDQRYQKMTRSHRGVANPQFDERDCRVHRRQFPQSLRHRSPVVSQCLDL